MSQQILLFLGAGPNVGTSTIREFKAKGFKIAAVSRNPIDEVKKIADLTVSGDFNNPNSISGIFEKVRAELGTPNVVIYNAFTSLSMEEMITARDVLVQSVDGLLKSFNINTLSAYAAAQEAVKGFATLPADVQKTFIFTGNATNTVVSTVPGVLGFGMSKGASWYMIQTLVAAFKDVGYRFYYVDERTPEGKGMRYLSGDAHAEFFGSLAESDDQGPAHATFVRGKGYVAVPGDERVNLPVKSMEEMADLTYGAPQ